MNDNLLIKEENFNVRCFSKIINNVLSADQKTIINNNDDTYTTECSTSLTERRENVYKQIYFENSRDCQVGDNINICGPLTINYNVENVLYQNNLQENIYINVPEPPINEMVLRHQWSAYDPLNAETNKKTDASDLVIICHTASDSSDKYQVNSFLVKQIQIFHMESRQWSDIGYNFLIGNDGRVYEGRGWQYNGAHTSGYNTRSIGISFIGIFEHYLPSVDALNACMQLLQDGVDAGYLTDDYKLICHCQVRPFKSPGQALYEFVQSWPHWSNEI